MNTDYDKLYKKLSASVYNFSNKKSQSQFQFGNSSNESFLNNIKLKFSKLKNPLIYGSIILLLVTISLFILKPSFIKVKDDETKIDHIKYGYFIATDLIISFSLTICIFFYMRNKV
jgi:hypothetical protein